MAAYLIGYGAETDAKAMLKYREIAPKALEEFGGKVIATQGKKLVLEGDWHPDSSVTIIEFPDFESAEGFYKSETYKKAKEARRNAINARIVVVEGI